MKKMYTRSGDDGYTSLLGNERVPKYHARPAAYGDLDEASAAMGLARATTSSEEIKLTLVQTQRDLYGLMAEIASTPENAARFRSIGEEQLQFLESKTDEISDQIDIPNEFIVPGDTQASAALSLARTITRRAERRIVKLYHDGELENQYILPYLNRLSSLLFVLELFEIETNNLDRPTFAKG